MKQALCVNLSALESVGLNTEVNTIQYIDISTITEDQYSYKDRAIVDDVNNVAEASLTPQILGYAVIRVMTATDIWYMVYRRPDKGNETRLHGLNSMGFGGHVEPVDAAVNTLGTLKEALKREIEEEVGLVIDLPLIHFSGVIYDTSNDVGKVHVGLVSIIDINLEELANVKPSEETGSIEMYNTESLFTNKEQFESWSQIIITALEN